MDEETRCLGSKYYAGVGVDGDTPPKGDNGRPPALPVSECRTAVDVQHGSIPARQRTKQKEYPPED